MPKRLCHLRAFVAGLLLGGLPALSTAQPATVDPALPVEQAVAAAESSLQSGDAKLAESRYRGVLFEGWLLLGALAALENELPVARTAYQSAAASSDENERALRSLALLDLRTGRAEQAIQELTRLTRKKPDDLELVFALASAHLQLKQTDLAQGLFAQLVKARPIPQTHVLVGRTYRDAGEHALARTQLQAALQKDARVRRAHYYLGMVALREKGRAGLEEAIREFQAELEIAKQDPLASLELGVALVLTQRHAEALAPLAVATAQENASPRVFAYQGRAQLGADRPQEAARSLSRALEMAQAQGANAAALRGIHLPLGQALRKLGRAEEAARHFAEAQRLSAEGTATEREQLAEYLADLTPAEAPAAPAPPVVEDPTLLALSPAQRSELRGRVAAALTRSYLNLGVLQAQGEQFTRAAELFEQANALSPDFPQVQSSLGVAYFNARQYAKATGPLTRALTGGANPQLRRMLALAWLNTENYEKAAEFLRDDPERSANASLQFAYGLSLVRLERAAEAERIFAELLRVHGESAELSVLIGQAHAQQGDFDSAIAALQRALVLKPEVAEANANLGIIYLRQGKFTEAEKALRAELAVHPDDLRAQQNLAIVLDSLDRGADAIPLLKSVLRAQPEYKNARYLVGKILLAQGQAAEALEHLEAATRLAPEDAPAHYQLGQAYQKLGRTEEARAQFEVFRQLKAKR